MQRCLRALVCVMCVSLWAVWKVVQQASQHVALLADPSHCKQMVFNPFALSMTRGLYAGPEDDGDDHLNPSPSQVISHTIHNVASRASGLMVSPRYACGAISCQLL